MSTLKKKSFPFHFCLLLLLSWNAGRDGESFYSTGSLPNPVPNRGLPHGNQGPNCSLPPRKLEKSMEPELDPRHSNIGCRHSEKCFTAVWKVLAHWKTDHLTVCQITPELKALESCMKRGRLLLKPHCIAPKAGLGYSSNTGSSSNSESLAFISYSHHLFLVGQWVCTH